MEAVQFRKLIFTWDKVFLIGMPNEAHGKSLVLFRLWGNKRRIRGIISHVNPEIVKRASVLEKANVMTYIWYLLCTIIDRKSLRASYSTWQVHYMSKAWWWKIATCNIHHSAKLFLVYLLSLMASHQRDLLSTILIKSLSQWQLFDNGGMKLWTWLVRLKEESKFKMRSLHISNGIGSSKNETVLLLYDCGSTTLAQQEEAKKWSNAATVASLMKSKRNWNTHSKRKVKLFQMTRLRMPSAASEEAIEKKFYFSCEATKKSTVYSLSKAKIYFILRSILRSSYSESLIFRCKSHRQELSK